jgi:hypothetical protein
MKNSEAKSFENLAKRRLDHLEYAEAGDQASRYKARDWATKAVSRSPSEVRTLYDATIKLDIAEDLVTLSKAFETVKDEYPVELSHHHLHLIRRYVLQRYAYREADSIRELIPKQEWDWWRWWQSQDFILWRLAMGVLAGFLLLGSSSATCDALWKAPSHGEVFWALCLGELFLVFALGLEEVARRNGTISLRKTLRRAVGLWWRGGLYAAAGGIVQSWLGHHLQYQDVTPQFVFLCSMTALIFGFVFQVFWQERSVGDPQ